MLMRLARLATSVVRDQICGAALRSSHWRIVRKEHLAQFPTCQACGAKWLLNVHHMRPFHLHPELELDLANLITLCMVNECHLLIGHGDDFKAYNPDVAADAASVLAAADRKAAIKALAPTVKAKRLYE